MHTHTYTHTYLRVYARTRVHTQEPLREGDGTAAEVQGWEAAQDG